MLTFTRTIKDGTAVEFEFTCEHDTIYKLKDERINFKLSKYEKFVAFDINTNRLSGLGYGVALISIAIEFAKNNNLDFVSGYLSFADRDNGNWKDSIPFYLKQRDDAFIIKTDTAVFLRLWLS